MLVDGYCSYIVAVVCGIDTVQCEVNTKRLKRGIEKNRIEVLTIVYISGRFYIIVKAVNVRYVGNNYKLMIVQALMIT